jgi:hypothetical protein
VKADCRETRTSWGNYSFVARQLLSGSLVPERATIVCNASRQTMAVVAVTRECL